MSIRHAEEAGTAARPAGTDVPGIREVTQDEITRFWENGWIRLPRLIDPGLVNFLLERAQRLMGPNGDANEERLGFDFETSPASQSFRSPSEVDELFQQVVHSRQLGRNAALLLGRDHAQRFFDDILLVKLPLSQREDRGQALGWHQDKNPTDRSWIYFWIPLDHVTPEQGAVRYLSGSHKLGPLWRGGACVDLDEAYRLAPRLRSCEMSDELSFEPGDVMAHCSWVVHGTDANVGDRARWVYRPSFLPADAVYMGVPSPTIAERGIHPFDVLDHPDFPVVYQPAPAGGAG
ncbi:phytanoyl-CoA dioxygenase family protein [Micromonospora sp. NPDC092111]|uniref:phytanoyl-CoA dioxygenase family protein n=1 Tax=Micromonospora sp. NPDC092111 TaxID=3364289 RepID=UPI0038289811